MRENRVWIPILVIFLAVVVMAQNQPQTTIKNIPLKNTSPSSGKEMYTTYCAVCHGEDGKGGGPAAEALRVPPANLTALSRKNGGAFPEMKVVADIRGETPLPAHGTREMPIWGQLFWGLSHGHEGEVQQRTMNLTSYVESLQEK